ncbi:MAG: hypothetical protein GY898_27740 [Proteobacteria bacterium]|nr:hypothetical protein [Pseudomonadota bacterium]
MSGDSVGALISSDAVLHLLDVDGRPLGEAASPALYAAAGIDETACPFSGARHGLPMNRAALRQLRSVWSEVLDDLAALHGPDPTLYGAWRACFRATLRPVVQLDREGADARVSRVEAAAYKTALDFSQVLTFLLLSDDGLGARPLRSFGDGLDLVEQLDQGGWLVGQVQACAGPASSIAELFEVLAAEPGPDDVEPTRDPAVEHAIEVVIRLAGSVLEELEHRRTGPPREGTDASRMLAEGRPSWIRAITAAPGRRAADVSRISAG